jgi:hypothetical protein
MKKDTKKVVINKCFGGFSLSYEAVMKYAEYKGFKLYPYFNDYKSGLSEKMQKYDHNKHKEDVFVVHYYKEPFEDITPPNRSEDFYFSERDIERDDQALVAVVKELGVKANAQHSELKIIEIPADIEYIIEEYDGLEHIAEQHRTWK